MTETVAAYAEYGPAYLPLPHPSWRVAIWMRKHPWFEAEVVPHLRESVARAMNSEAASLQPLRESNARSDRKSR
jgi:hypothetical protein